MPDLGWIIAHAAFTIVGCAVAAWIGYERGRTAECMHWHSQILPRVKRLEGKAEELAAGALPLCPKCNGDGRISHGDGITGLCNRCLGAGQGKWTAVSQPQGGA